MRRQLEVRRAITVILFAVVLFVAVLPAAAAEVQISVEPGEEWIHTWHILWIFPMRNMPQMALWIEDVDGNYVATIYVTQASAAARWNGTDRRPSSLPVWAHAHGVEYAPGSYMPTADQPLPDAVTGATPRDAFTKTWVLPDDLAPGTYMIWAEINHSFDDNDFYNDRLPENDPNYDNGVNGQPSVIWSGELIIGGESDTIQLTIIGHGEAAGRDGEINTDLSGLTTALHIVESIVVRYIP